MERKLATILFADLVGSTELGASLDPEYARDLLDRFYDAMEAEIALGGGTVEKFIGDAVVAVFGAPAAQEDHAERALQVALWMQERLPAGTAFRLGRCLSYGRSVTYSALADVLREELGLRHEDSAEDVLERLAGREILGLTLGLDVAGELEPRAALLRLQDEWVHLISQLGANTPAVLAIEDLHWAAEPLVEVLERVLSDAEGQVLVLATMRPERSAFPAADMLRLERLADEEVAELLEAALAA